ncbi:hypothetical protein WA171_001435, partial [Blastocystis sp. BT1]
MNDSEKLSDSLKKSPFSKKEFWDSVHTLSFQEKALYDDADYSKGSIPISRIRRKHAFKVVRNALYIFFLFLLICDFINVIICAVCFYAWKLLLCGLTAYGFLFVGNYVRKLRFSLILIFFFVYYRNEAIQYYISQSIQWALPPTRLTKLLLGSYLLYFTLDQIVDYH